MILLFTTSFIVSFLVVATLVVGVGFAQLTGNMVVSGRATFMGKTFTQSTVLQSLKFIAKEEENCTVDLVTDPSTNSTQNSTMTVDFHDVTGSTNRFEATAVLTIQYGEEGASLPPLTLGSIDNRSTVVPDGDAATKGQFTITSEWVTGTTGSWTGNGNGQLNLEAGDIVFMRVTVVYEKPYDEEEGEYKNVDSLSCDASIHIVMPWATEAE